MVELMYISGKCDFEVLFWRKIHPPPKKLPWTGTAVHAKSVPPTTRRGKKNLLPRLPVLSFWAEVLNTQILLFFMEQFIRNLMGVCTAIGLSATEPTSSKLLLELKLMSAQPRRFSRLNASRLNDCKELHQFIIDVLSYLCVASPSGDELEANPSVPAGITRVILHQIAQLQLSVDFVAMEQYNRIISDAVLTIAFRHRDEKDIVSNVLRILRSAEQQLRRAFVPRILALVDYIVNDGDYPLNELRVWLRVLGRANTKRTA